MALIPPTRKNLAGLTQREIEFFELIAGGNNDNIDTIEEVANFQQSILSRLSQAKADILGLQQDLADKCHESAALKSQLGLLQSEQSILQARLSDLENLVSAKSPIDQVLVIGLVDIAAPPVNQVIASGAGQRVTVFDTVVEQNGLKIGGGTDVFELEFSGLYQVGYNVTCDISTNNTNVKFSLYVTRNAIVTEIQSSIVEQRIQNSNDDFNANVLIPILGIGGDTYELRAEHDSGGNVTFDFSDSNYYLFGNLR